MVKKILRTTIVVASIIIVAMAGATVYKTFFENRVGAASSFSYSETWTADEAVYSGDGGSYSVWTKGGLPGSGRASGSGAGAAIAVTKWTVRGTVTQ